MNAAAIIERIRTAGGEITLADENIKLKIPASLRDALVAEVKARKDAIKRVLKSETRESCSVDDYHAFYDERVGIAEIDGGLSRGDAEIRAFNCCVSEWLNRNPATSSPECCCHCGKAERAGAQLIPFGYDPYGHAWLHRECWPAWFDSSQKKAINALKALGINKPAKFAKDFGKNKRA